jgi:glycosyltransferase involved in cell wall biosynthesis
MSKVSVIIPTYNGEKFIGRAIQSVLGQTLRDFEIIVVDDASRDGTVLKVKELAKNDKRIKLTVLPVNTGGPAVPRTVGCKAAQGDLIAFLDQDDMYLPKYLEKKVAYFDRHPEINLISSWAWMFDEKTKKIIDCGGGGPVNTMARKEVLPAVGYFKASQNNVDDAAMRHRYNKVYGTEKELVFEDSDGPLTLYSRNATQESAMVRRNPQVFIKRIDSLLAEIDPDESPSPRNRLSRLYSRKGNCYCLMGEFSTGRHFFAESLKQEFNIFALALFIASFLPWFYGAFESLSRFFQLKIIAQVRVIRKRTRYEKSYQTAKRILAIVEAGK